MEIVQAIGSIFSGVAGIVTADKQIKATKYAKVPQWLSGRDFYESDNTLSIVIIGMVAITLVLVIALAKK